MTESTKQSRGQDNPSRGGVAAMAMPQAVQVRERQEEWDRVVKVTCHTNCSYQRACVLNAFVKDGQVVRVEQATNYPVPNDPSVPDWNPRGCQKGLDYVHRMYDPGRIKYPLKRAGKRGDNQWQRVSWDQALTDIADAMIDVLLTDGPQAVSSFGGSGGGLASDGISFEAMFRALGVASSNPTGEVGDDHSGAAQVFGQPFVGCSADNWFYADLFLIWGGNPSYTNITNYHFITEARYNGTKVITISPDYSPSTVPADQWVPVNIGTDAALALAIAQVMMTEKLYNAAFIREQTDLPLLVRNDNKRYLREKDLKRGGREDAFYFWDTRANKLTEAPRKTLALDGAVPALESEYEVSTLEGRVRVKPVFQVLKDKVDAEYTPERASRVCGTSPRLIVELAREMGKAQGMVNISTFNWGKFYHGDLLERSIILLFVLGGHFGRKGDTYNAFTSLATDATISGVEVRGSISLRAAASGDPRFARWQQEGYTQEMMVLEYAKDVWRAGGVFGTSLFHYIHSGLLELSQKHKSWDPNLNRPVKEYVDEAFAKGWQTVVPPRGKDPRIIFNMGGSTIRRARATDVIVNTLLPKLRLLVEIDFRMSSTGVYADYILPAAGWWEKFSFQGLGKPEFPLAFLINKAVEPLDESKNEWEMGCLLAKKLQERARQRGVLSYSVNGAQKRLDDIYERVTVGGLYLEDDEESACRDYFANSANVQQIPWEELQEQGFSPAIGVGLNARSIGNACDIVPGEPLIPLTWHTDKKEPYPTLTRRMQIYIDHDWYLELRHELPTQLEDPKAGGDYPLRITGGHARWSIHSNHIDNSIILRLQRGTPTMFMSAQDAKARGIQDGDTVEVGNDLASFRINASVSPAVRSGQVMIYHAWENFQFPGKHHFKSVMASPLNPIELAGGYFHIQPWPVSFYPGFSDRDTRVEVKKV